MRNFQKNKKSKLPSATTIGGTAMLSVATDSARPLQRQLKVIKFSLLKVTSSSSQYCFYIPISVDFSNTKQSDWKNWEQYQLNWSVEERSHGSCLPIVLILVLLEASGRKYIFVDSEIIIQWSLNLVLFLFIGVVS